MVPTIDTQSNHNLIDAPDPTARQRFRAVLAEVAAQAKQALPAAVNGRVEKGCKLVLAADVVLRSDGSAEVGSRSSVETVYTVTSGGCPCGDAKRADIEGWCAHRIARALLISVQRRLAEAPAPAPATSTPATGVVDEPRQRVPADTPASHPPAAPAPGIPQQFLTELHGRTFVQYAGLLALAHAQGLVSIAAHFISVSDTLALAEASIEFADGRTFSECADSTPENVGKQVRPHFARLALTRAKARALRDALNIGMVCVEELEG